MQQDHFLWLRPGIRVLRDGEELILIEQGGEVVQLQDPSTLALALVDSLDGGQRASALSANPFFPVVVPLLQQRGWLVTLRQPLASLLARHMPLSREVSAFAHLYPDDLDWHFGLLARKKVLIVGVGGIGSNLAFALCANGVGALTVVDLDVVEATNLNRQFLFTAEDLGQPKVHVLARELGRRFAGTAIQAVYSNFDDPALAAGLLQGVDLVVVCGESGVLHDNPQLCDGIPILLSGYQGAVGVVGPLLDAGQGTACWRCVMARYARPAMRQVESSARQRANAWNPSGFAINAMTGSICANIAVGFLSEQPAAAQWLGVQLKASSATLEIGKTRVEPHSCAHTTATLCLQT